MATRTLVGIGEILWDVFGREKHPGGAPANFAYHARALGDHGIAVSRVGRDALGDELLDALSALGTPTDYIQRDRRLPTGTVVVKLDRAGVPRFTITPNVAWDNLRVTRTLLSLARRADAVCYGTLARRAPVSRRTLRSFLAAVRGALRVCDLNLRAEFLSIGPRGLEHLEIVIEALHEADVLKLNDEELRILGRAFGRGEAGDAFLCWLLREFRLWLVCVTRGERGCVLRTARRRVAAPGVRVRVADTVGAGDAFTAAMVHHLLRRRPLAEVAAFANRVGAYVASKPGATPVMPAHFH